MPRVDAQAELAGEAGGVPVRGPRSVRRGIVQAARFDQVRVGPRVEFDPVCADGLGMANVGLDGIHEEADARPPALVAVDERRHARAGLVRREVPAVIRGQLAVVVRHQRALMRTGRLDQPVEAGIPLARRRVRVAFDVELRPWILVDDRPQLMHIVGADVAPVRPRMHGDAGGARFQNRPGAGHHVRSRTFARIAQPRDLVDVDRQRGHFRSVSLGAASGVAGSCLVATR